MWVRGLKLGHLAPLDVEVQSHPMWVRGLKHRCVEYHSLSSCRTLCGCVDWNFPYVLSASY